MGPCGVHEVTVTRSPKGQSGYLKPVPDLSCTESRSDLKREMEVGCQSELDYVLL